MMKRTTLIVNDNVARVSTGVHAITTNQYGIGLGLIFDPASNRTLVRKAKIQTNECEYPRLQTNRCLNK
jgi:hypothetical protein